MNTQRTRRKRALRAGALCLAIALTRATSALAQINTVQSTWATPYMTTEFGGDPIPHGSSLQPNTTYY